MINLELTDINSQRVVDINKSNYLLIGDYDGYFKFYTYFYECLINKNKDYKIRIDNNNVDSKNTVLFDFTSVYNILLALEFKKGSLLYEHMISNLNSLDDEWLDDLDTLLLNLTKHLNNTDNDFDYSINEDVRKMITQYIGISYDKDDFKNVFRKLLDEFLGICVNKRVIIFINTMLVNFDFSMFDNVFVFDVNCNVALKRYNLISLDEVKELDFGLIKSKIYNDYPINLNEGKVNNFISVYYKYLLFSKTVRAYSEDELIVYTLLSKYNKIKQEIIPQNIIVGDNIKSFLSNI